MNEPNLIKKDTLTDKVINKQKRILIIGVFCVLTLFIGSSYALLTNFDKTDNVINFTTGNLNMTVTNSGNSLTLTELNGKLPETDQTGLQNATPIVLTLTNTGTMFIDGYEVKLVSDETQTSTLNEDYIKYAISLDNGTTYSSPSILTSNNNIIFTGYDLEVDESQVIYLKLWIDENAGNYALNKEYYGSIQVELYQYKEKVYPISTELLKSKVGTGGLVAINSDGDLYNASDTTQTIREYRYSGPTVDNYAYFNCNDTDGTYEYGDENYDYANNCEVWRVVGIFKDTVKDEDGNVVLDSEGNPTYEEEVKLVRNTMLTAAELPESYAIGETTYTIAYSATSSSAYWNYVPSSTNRNDWTTAGLQYYLNTEKDETDTSDGTTTANAGYLSLLTNEAKEMISPTTYYLGNVVYNSDTPKSAYVSERTETQIWSGNQASWDGQIGLLYPSDYGYSANNLYWETDMWGWDAAESDGVIASDTSWMHLTMNEPHGWLLSPSSSFSDIAVGWSNTGCVNSDRVNSYYGGYGVHPVLNLKSGAKVIDGAGTEEDPFVFAID